MKKPQKNSHICDGMEIYMKKTAKFLSLLLAAVMLLLSFASCDVISGIIGGNGDSFGY